MLLLFTTLIVLTSLLVSFLQSSIRLKFTALLTIHLLNFLLIMKTLSLSIDYFKSKFSPKELISSSFFAGESDSDLKAKFESDPYSFFSSDFIEKMSSLRQRYNKPIYLTCSYRSEKHDLLKGRSGCGYHTLGRAFDIFVKDNSARYCLVNCAILAGFTGIGIYPSFIHLDNRPEPIIWYGYNS